MVAAYLPSASWFSGSYAPAHRKDALSATDPLSSFGTRLMLEETAQKTLNRIQPQSKTELAARTVTTLSLADLSITFVRNALRLIPSIGPNHSVVRDLGIASASIGIVIGSSVTVGNGIANLYKAQAIGDVEGTRRAASRIVSGSVSTTTSTLSFIGIFVTAALSSALGITTLVFCGLGSIFNLGISGWGIAMCAQFRSRINAYLEMKQLSDQERVLEALEYLKTKIAPTEEEKEGISREVEALHPDWSPEQKLNVTKRKILNLAEVKIRFIKRRTDQKTAERILLEVDKHIERLQNPVRYREELKNQLTGQEDSEVKPTLVISDIEEKHLAEAKELIAQVMERNKKKIQLSLVVATTSAIAFAALLIGTFLSLGILPLALYMLSSAIALGILLIPFMIEALSRSTNKAMESRRALALAPVTVVTTNINS